MKQTSKKARPRKRSGLDVEYQRRSGLVASLCATDDCVNKATQTRWDLCRVWGSIGSWYGCCLDVKGVTTTMLSYVDRRGSTVSAYCWLPICLSICDQLFETWPISHGVRMLFAALRFLISGTCLRRCRVLCVIWDYCAECLVRG